MRFAKQMSAKKRSEQGALKGTCVLPKQKLSVKNTAGHIANGGKGARGEVVTGCRTSVEFTQKWPQCNHRDRVTN